VDCTGGRIDHTIDFEADSSGKDSDQSPTLRCYHLLLWSKPLPIGAVFDLVEYGSHYVRDRSGLGAVTDSPTSNRLSSDWAVPTFRYYSDTADVVRQMPPGKIEAAKHLFGTIGGRIVWPAKQLPGVPTMNQAKGRHPKIRDRMDLTLECIRRYYQSTERALDTAFNPLGEVIEAYAAFFGLFVDFAGYVEFFLLQDLVASDGSVKFMMPFDDFRGGPLPRDVSAYSAYLAAATAFIEARNVRVQEWAAAHLAR
jgi:hypothetical protein